MEAYNFYNGIVREGVRKGGREGHFCVLSRVASQLKMKLNQIKIYIIEK